MQPLVSVLMPSYNSEKFIGAAIQSVLDSTYKNFELIITDDRSTDDTYLIAQSYAEKDSRIRLILNEKNYGDYPNRNQAALYATGKYLKYVDHDDYIYPYGLEQLVFYMEQFPKAGYGLCSLEQDVKKVYPIILNPQEAYFRNYFESGIFHKAPLSSIIRREVFEKTGGFTGKPFLGDFEYWHILSQEYNVLLMPQGIVWYRVHENQESRKLDGSFIAQMSYYTVAKQQLTATKCPLNKTNTQKAIRIIDGKIARFILSTIKNHSLKKGLELKKYAKISSLSLLKNLK